MIALKDYLILCKPKVVLLMLITVWVGMLLASSQPLSIVLFGCTTLGIGCTSSAAAVLNHLLERNIDAKMQRTQQRPLVNGRIKPYQAFCFAGLLGSLGLSLLWTQVNPLTAQLTFLSMIGYAVIYTLFLKRATPQNIVIGGLAGATPPLLGWCAVTGQAAPYAWLLVLIIFTWTPWHFWALAIAQHSDYRKAGIPMLPITHGIAFTKDFIVLYALLMVASSLLPFATGMSGGAYLLGACLLNGGCLYRVSKLWMLDSLDEAHYTFHFSILYLLGLFMALLFDHYTQGLLYGYEQIAFINT